MITLAWLPAFWGGLGSFLAWHAQIRSTEKTLHFAFNLLTNKTSRFYFNLHFNTWQVHVVKGTVAVTGRILAILEYLLYNE